MKKLVFIMSIALFSCKKYAKEFDCVCSNKENKHYSEPYEMAKSLCHQRAVDLSAKNATAINCYIR